MYGSVICTFSSAHADGAAAPSAISTSNAQAAVRASARRHRVCEVRGCHWVLQVPTFGSAGVNMLLAAELNSSWPCGIGRLIQ